MDHPLLQRRYLISFEARRLGHIFTDVLVIGSGAAGLRAAIEASQFGEVIVATKDALTECNTLYAQGGLAAVLDARDSLDDHVADTLSAGCGINDDRVVREVLAASPEHIRQLQTWGMRFDGVGDTLDLGREGGHSANRVVHAAGDATGRILEETLVRRAHSQDNVKVFDHCFVMDLVTDPPVGGDGATCVGALTYHERYGLQMILARQVILAAGGTGMLWRETSNPPIATADGMAMAFRAGATITDAELMQFHPTTLYVAGATRSLISEAVRGEGAHLVDREGQRFMDKYHEMAELAPRDVVSRAILSEMVAAGATHAYLDVRHLGGEAFARRFPQIAAQCRQFDIDPAADLIPIHPAAHYMIGGVGADLDGQTSMPGLWACGEAAATGLHGANRLASNSLVEALVLGSRCGRSAGQAAIDAGKQPVSLPIDWAVALSDRTELDLTDIGNSLRSVMWRNVGIVRHGQRLAETLEIVGFWGRYVLDKEFYDPAGWQMQNMLTAAFLISSCAKQRTETRGVHYREDFPETDPAWARHQRVRRSPDELILE
ncbi:MAG: L-aspartate oxidase [Planctomycetota bacterium]|jgi:L-aspartate oxidase